jgi:hypothetical protein
MTFGSPTSVDLLILAFRTMLDPEAPLQISAPTLSCNWMKRRLGLGSWAARERGQVIQPDAVLEGDTRTLKALAFEGLPLTKAMQSGTLTVTGDRAVAERFFKLFRLPEPVILAASA